MHSNVLEWVQAQTSSRGKIRKCCVKAIWYLCYGIEIELMCPLYLQFLFSIFF